MTEDLRAEGLTLAYGGNPVVANLDLAIPSGRFTVLAGQNGSGKSTVLRALSGALSPTSGKVTLGGQPIARWPIRALARRISILPQDPQAPEGMRVDDLVRMGRYPHRGILSRWTETDELAMTEALRLTGTVAMRDQMLDRLSGGQRQRAWIAMVLAQQSDIVLLDEPISFLDLAHQLEILHLVQLLVATGRTVVAVLHDLNQAARHADHMVILKAGRILTSGPPLTVMTPDTIREGFGVEALVIADPATGAPMCCALPLPSGNTAAVSRT